jgi:hypothetical protein
MLNQLLLRTFIQKREEDIKAFKWLLERGKISDSYSIGQQIQKKQEEITEARRFLSERFDDLH